MAITKIYNGSSWANGRLKHYTGSAWIDVPKYYNGSTWEDLNAQLVVSGSDASVINYRLLAICYAGVQFNSSGVEYACTPAGAFTTSRGNWLDFGLSSEVWVSRVVTGDSLNWQDPGAGRWQLNTTRQFGLSRSLNGFRTTTVTFSFWDAASGGNLLDVSQVDLSAEYDNGS